MEYYLSRYRFFFNNRYPYRAPILETEISAIGQALFYQIGQIVYVKFQNSPKFCSVHLLLVDILKNSESASVIGRLPTVFMTKQYF